MQGKLDKSLVPLHYSIRLAPSFTTFTFSGKVDINCELRQATDRIHINAKQLKVEAVTVILKDVEVEEEERQRSRKSPSSSGSRSPLPDQDHEGGDEEDHEAEGGDEKKGVSGSEESNRSGRGKVSRLQEDWDDDDEEEYDGKDEEEVHEAETDNEEVNKSVDNENISGSSQLNSSRITQKEGSDLSNYRDNFADCSDNSDESNSSVNIGAVKRKSANDSIDGISDSKYKKSAQTQQNWGVWQDDEVYAVSDDDDKEGDRCRLGKRSQIESQGDHSEDIVQVDGADSDMEDGEEPWHLVKTSQTIVEVSSFKVLEERELLEINLQTRIQPCHLTITVTYSGTLDDSMRGFYRTHHPEGWGAACHFEATGARKCFPCIDQPEFKTTFDISVTRPSPCHTVLSNMPAKDEDSSGVVSFARTPEMPTYLVCVIVGYYSSLSHRTQCGVPVSVFTPSGRTR